jgi:hypothetical protein
MNPRLAAMAAWFREVAVPASVLVFAMFGSGGIDHIGAAPIAERLAPLLAADASFADKSLQVAPLQVAPFQVAPSQVASNTADVSSTVDVVPASRPISDTTAVDLAPAAAVDPAPAAREPEAVVTAASTSSSEVLPPETPPDHAAETKTAALEPDDAIPAARPAEPRDECLAGDPCIDRYLWTLYERTPKEDSIKTQERKKVTVKKKGRLVTITKTFTRLADEDFAWKDPKAAEHVGMPMADYVIGGVDRDFKLKLFHMLHAAEEAGLSPGITSAFRDDYRQSIASGLKAANDRSYHGGSFRGGYGHGLAADIVSVNGATRAQRLASSEILWNWVDAHGKEFGIGRPYLDRDPPHVAPIDGKEYADHHSGMKARQTRLAAKQQTHVARRSHRV